MVWKSKYNNKFVQNLYAKLAFGTYGLEDISFEEVKEKFQGQGIIKSKVKEFNGAWFWIMNQPYIEFEMIK